jgi:hypothetical protein
MVGAVHPAAGPQAALGLEADAVIEMPDGRWAAFEVKLGLRGIAVIPIGALTA